MQLGMIGLGRMGANMVRRLLPAATIASSTTSTPTRSVLAAEGMRGARALQELVATLTPPRARLDDGAGRVRRATIAELAPLLAPGDTIIDGGNSWYRDDIDRAEPLARQGIHYVDVGTSGGVFGLERGYCLMVGGDDEGRRAA